jgi:hypothetical protein
MNKKKKSIHDQYPLNDHTSYAKTGDFEKGWSDIEPLHAEAEITTQNLWSEIRLLETDRRDARQKEDHARVVESTIKLEGLKDRLLFASETVYLNRITLLQYDRELLSKSEGYRVLHRVLGEVSKHYFRTMSHYLNNDEAELVAWLIARTDDGKPFNYVQIGERMGGISSTTVMNRRNKLMGKNKEVEDFLNRILPRPPRGTRNG